MTMIRLRGLCEAGNVCLTLIRDTDTGDALLQGPLDPAAAATLKAPDGEGGPHLLVGPAPAASPLTKPSGLTGGHLLEHSPPPRLAVSDAADATRGRWPFRR